MTDERSRAADLDRRLSGAGGELRDGAADEHALADLALEVRRALQPPAPRAAFTAAARRRLLNRLPAPPRLVISGAVRRFAFAAISVLLAFTLGTAGVAYAAQEALPGEALYGVKRGLESARWSLTSDPEAQVELLSAMAAERVQEVEALAVSGDDALVEQTLEDYQQTLEQMQSSAAGLPAEARSAALAQAEVQMQQHVIVLERVKAQVPEQAQAAIERALEGSSHSRQVFEQLEQGGSPSDLAPWLDPNKDRGPKRTPGPPESKGRP
ncbi:MAG: hypothetical protein FJZ97_02500 [Chloroflexi bacterium]|nr:hypothetical protein [Chloroflexota bacterium]